MEIGKNIKEIRITRCLTEQQMADQLGIDVKDYIAIEEDAADITISLLEKIANLLSCEPFYVLGYRKLLGSIYNHFENQNGNKGINIKFQGLNPKELRKFYNDLYTNELNRIPKLEKLLRDRGIEFDF